MIAQTGQLDAEKMAKTAPTAGNYGEERNKKHTRNERYPVPLALLCIAPTHRKNQQVKRNGYQVLCLFCSS